MSEVNVPVVIPAYNRVDYVVESIGDVLVQTARQRVVIVDDASIDGTVDGLTPQHTCGEIHVIHQVNGGLSRGPTWPTNHRVRATILVSSGHVRHSMGCSSSWHSSPGSRNV